MFEEQKAPKQMRRVFSMPPREPDFHKQTKPHSHFVQPALTDLYQISMAYAYWFSQKQDESAVFDLFFRKNPFKGEFTIFAGLEECLKFISSYKFPQEHVQELRSRFPTWKVGFWDWLLNVDCSKVKVYAMEEGTVVFPRVPLLRIEGPLGICQLLETTLLCCVNFASLLATNAARHRLAAGENKQLVEFGLRRAQGPDGAMSASRYAYIGGFHGTSNVLAGIEYSMPIYGTHAHSFVSSFQYLKDLPSTLITTAEGKEVNFVDLVLKKRTLLNCGDTNEGGVVLSSVGAVTSKRRVTKGFLALVDTYDTLKSGVPNFLAVCLALADCGFEPRGIRLDSGDLAYLSREARRMFRECSAKFNVNFDDLTIVASNDLSERVIHSLNEQTHEIDSFGIGTNLVTCKAQPALGCVYKLVEIGGVPRIKISQEKIKITIPGRKEAYRLYNKSGQPLTDIMIQMGKDPVPQVDQRILCRHPFEIATRCYVTPKKVEKLHQLLFADGKIQRVPPPLSEVRDRVQAQLAMLRPDILRNLNPTPYKISVSNDLFAYIQVMWTENTPIPEIF